MRLIENIEVHPDREFLEIVEQIISTVVEQSGVKELFLVEIENWFNYKWLHYARKFLIPIWTHTAMVPPFPPARILSERQFRRALGADQFARDAGRERLHAMVERSFRERRFQKITDVSQSAVFVWYSSNATANKAASLMVYVAAKDRVHAWFAAFRKDGEWRLDLTRDIRREAVLELMSPNPAFAGT
jgi:hypothetical protein